MIKIVTGPIRSGKTTRLAAWVRGQDEVAGFLTPDDRGVRVFYDIGASATLPFALPCDTEEETVVIGPFCFSAHTFVYARRLLHAAAEAVPPLMVVDEVGKLELAGKGFEPDLAPVIDVFRSHPKATLVLVVRESLLLRVCRRFEIASIEIFALPAS